jgi:hypothetical protein
VNSWKTAGYGATRKPTASKIVLFAEFLAAERREAASSTGKKLAEEAAQFPWNKRSYS